MDEPDALRFDAAINPYGCSPRVVEAIAKCARARDYRFYGEPTAAALREQLAAHHGLAPDNFVIYNGAGEALVWLFVVHLVMAKGRLVAPAPSYERFIEAGKRTGAEVIEVPLEEESYALPVERMIEEACHRKATLGLISSPNNPTGNLLLDFEKLSRLLDEAPQCLWIVDEAYADYARVSFAPLVREQKNLIVLRTFSKAYGLAGWRVGAVVAHRSVAAQLTALRIPWCVNSLSLVAAQAALEDQIYLEETIERIHEDCREFHSSLNSVPDFYAYESAANFFLVRLERSDASLLKNHLASHGIHVRSRPDMPRHIRVTSLRPEENRRLSRALNDAAVRR